MKIEMTYDDLYNVFGACQSTVAKMIQNQQKGNGKFLNFLFNNRDRARVILVPIEEKRPKAWDKLNEYSTKLNALVPKVKEPVEGEKQPDPEVIKADQEKLEKDRETLRLEYKEDLDKWQKLTEKFIESLQKKIEFEPVTLKEENLPTEVDVNVMETLYRFVINK